VNVHIRNRRCAPPVGAVPRLLTLMKSPGSQTTAARSAVSVAALTTAIALLAACAPPAHGCGPFFPNSLLADPDGAALAAPNAVFELELERMRLIETNRRARPSKDYAQDTLAAELEDLRQALDRSGVSSEDRDRIVVNHRLEREKITLFTPRDAAEGKWSDANAAFELRPAPTNDIRIAPDAMPRMAAGLPGEFADYFRGSVAWHLGDIAGARVPWLHLLERPAAERHFKSTWATYMLGKSWEEENPGRAIAHFRKVRALADAGFADSLGLSVASLGWEARLCRRAKRLGDAIELYLEQHAAGDPSAAVSLGFVASDALRGGFGALQPLARRPRPQRVVTAYLIAGGHTAPAIDIDSPLKEGILKGWEAISTRIPAVPAPKRSWHTYREPVLLWLEAVERADVRDVESAEQLALAAYQGGDIQAAERWLQRARSTPVTQWLRAKLLLRQGNMPDAAALLAAICRQFPVVQSSEISAVGDESRLRPSHAESALAADRLSGKRLADNLNTPAGSFETVPMNQQVMAEISLERLARRQFVEALDALLHSSPVYWMDVAYVAERVLTLPELVEYVDRHCPPSTPLPADLAPVSDADELSAFEAARQATPKYPPAERIRYLLARRLVRANRCADARRYFPPDWLPLFDRFLVGRLEADRGDRSTEQRAWGLLEAARMTRRYGLELLGTEVEPDWRIHDGNFEWGVTLATRSTLTTNALGPSLEEIARAQAHRATPERRWHYRHTAAVLAQDAARLLCQSRGPNTTPAQRAEALMRAARFTVDHNVSWVPGADDDSAPDEPAPPSGDPMALLWNKGYTASALAWEAARLLPDNSDDTAGILCLGGRWIATLDPSVADLFYKALVNRNRRTALGIAADKLRWFPSVDRDGRLLPPSAD